jgi:hypothetical protein
MDSMILLPQRKRKHLVPASWRNRYLMNAFKNAPVVS